MHETGKPHVATDDYYIPEHIQPHVDFITPTVHFDTKMGMAKELPKRNLNGDVLEKRAPVSTAAAGTPVQTKAAVKDITNPANGFHPKKGSDINIQNIITELENCNRFIVPDCLRVRTF